MTLSTHVLDATAGQPAAGVYVRLECVGETGWRPVAEGETGPDGRLRFPGDLDPGVYRLMFATRAYFEPRGMATFYPQVSITFEMTERAEHYHVPLLLSPFGYSTYRGS
jgi:5-hydroxyisourate hydrolase